MPEGIQIDDQPIASTFFGEGKWLTDFITPNALEVQELHKRLTSDLEEQEDRLLACWEWVGSLKYKKFVTGKLWIEGKVSVQQDLWNTPRLTSRVEVGNCINKSFLLTSLLRLELGPESVHCAIGNLYNGTAGGHAWVQVNLGGQDYIMEATTTKVRPLVLARTAERYEAVHLFNDKEVYTIQGKSVCEPYTACYSPRLSDYLDWIYINGGK